MNYLFAGNDPYLKEEALAKLKRRLFGENIPAFNISVFYGDTDNAEDILGCARTVPFGGPGRLVIVKKADCLGQKDLKAVLTFLQTPFAQTTLVLECEGDVPGDKDWREMLPYLKAVKATDVKGPAFDKFVQEKASAYGKTVDPAAISLLKERIGQDDAGALANEMEKLALFSGKKDRITLTDVEAVVGRTVNYDVFRLADTINRKDLKSALEVLDNLMVKNIRAHEVLGLLGWQIRKVYSRDKRLLKSRKSLKRTIELLLSTDLEIKTSGMDPRTALEITLTKLCS